MCRERRLDSPQQPPQNGSRTLKGHSKRNPTDPDVVGWFLGGQKSTRVGQFFDFFVVFLNSPHRETPKNVRKKSRTKRFWILLSIFLQNVFCSVFELPSLRNTRKLDKTKKVEKNLTSNFLVDFFGKSFRH
jgi:hypothetical protein